MCSIQLEDYYLMSEDVIFETFKKTFNIVDNSNTDQLLVSILVHRIKNSFSTFNDIELSILHMYFDIRTNIGFVEFKKIYPILKRGVDLLTYNSKLDIAKKLNKMLNLSMEFNEPELLSLYSNSPVCKNTYPIEYGRCISPTCQSISTQEDLYSPESTYSSSNDDDFWT